MIPLQETMRRKTSDDGHTHKRQKVAIIEDVPSLRSLPLPFAIVRMLLKSFNHVCAQAMRKRERKWMSVQKEKDR